MHSFIPRLFLILWILAATACTPLIQSPSPLTDASIPNPNTTEFYAPWQSVLTEYVSETGSTDFAALKQDSESLERFVGYIGRVSPHTHPDLFEDRRSALSFYVNSYNALAMYGIIKKGIPDNFGTLWRRAKFFYFTDFQVGGKAISLYDYENDIIRKLDEPRTHFALNCMVKDCPRLPKEAFLSATLDSQFDAVSREFFSKPIHIRVDHDSRSAHLSEILSFYTDDFISEDTPTLIDYVNLYREEKIPGDYSVEFIPYDWTVNAWERERSLPRD